MGAALEWLGPEGCQSVAEHILSDVRPHGDELWAACPWHVEKTVGGSFSYNPDLDKAKCLSCSAAGDLIAVYAALHGLENDEAFTRFREEFAPGSPVLTRPKSAPVRRSWTPAPAEPSPARWSDRAGEFVRHSVERLKSNPEALAQLAAWGVPADVAEKCMIGWNDKDKAVPRPSWGLEPLHENGREKKIWLPAGLVFPMLAAGRVVKIKIRRPNPEMPGGKSLRYWEVPGGAIMYHRYGRPDCRVWVLVETERDGAMIWGQVRDLGIGVMALGGATKRPDADNAAVLRASDLILNALDNDQAGAVNTATFWQHEFPQQVRWPVPPSAGKDPGEAVGEGLDIRAWVLAGLPSHIARALPARRPAPAPQPEPQPLPAPTVTPAEQPYAEWYMGQIDAILSLIQGTPVTVDGHSGLAVAPQKWSLVPANWTRLRRLDELLASDPGQDLVTEAMGSNRITYADLAAAAVRLEKWFAK
jgi:hypothetical protein